MPDVPDSQGAVLSFKGTTLGVLQNAAQAFKAGNVHEVTSMRSEVLGDGPYARVVRQYNVTSIEPGTFTARFIGLPNALRNDIGSPGTLTFTWRGQSISAQAFLEALDQEQQRGELVQWAATFRFSGF